MKLQTLLLFITISALTLNAQEFERTYQESPMMSGHVIYPLDNGDFLVGTQSTIELSQSQAGLLYKMDSQGNILWSTLHALSRDKSVVTDIIMNTNNEIHVVHSSTTCDEEIVFNHLVKIDKETGEIICSSGTGDNIYSRSYTKLIDLANSNFVLFAGETLATYSASCNPIQLGFSSADINIVDAVHIMNSKFFTVGPGEFGIFDGEEVEFDFIQTGTSKKYVGVDKATDGNLFLLHENGLEKRSITIDLQTEIDAPAGATYTNIVMNDNLIFVLGKNDDQNFLSVFDHDLETISSHYIAASHVYPTDMHLDENRLLMCGFVQDNIINQDLSIPSQVQPHQLAQNLSGASLWTKAIVIDNIENELGNDIGVVDITLDQLFYDDRSNCTSSESKFENATFQNVEVTVKNYGTAVVNKLNINSQFVPCETCDLDLSFSKAFEDLNLAPNEEMVLSIGDIVLENLKANETSYELCLWTSAPDNELDENQSNNTLCIDLTNINVSTDEFSNTINWDIYPNPVEEELFIAYNLEEAAEISFKLFDLLGNEVLKTTVTKRPTGEHQETISISATNLENGIYILMGYFGNEFISEKIHIFNNN